MLLAIFRLLAVLPLSFMQAMGRVLGRVIYALPGRYRQRLRRNAQQAGYTGAAFARRAAAQSGAMIAEIPHVWLRSQDCLKKTLCPDAHVLHTALAERRGVLVLTPHLGCFEMVARVLTTFGPTTVMYRPPHKAILTAVMMQARNAPGLHAVPANRQGIRAFLQALRAGQVVGMLPDQVPSQGEGVWVPFFDAPALTMTLAGRLAHQACVPIVSIAGERLPRGRGWRMHMVRLPEPFPKDPAAMATLINQAMETLIRRFPEQYLWSYNRYKTPAGAQTTPNKGCA